MFLSGFIGAGATFSGGQNDEDFNASAFTDNRYNNTFSTNNGSINYAVVDLGYDVLRSADYKVGPFVGYTVFNQYIFKGGCQQVASTTGNCAVGTATPPLPSSQLIGLEDMTWQALRIGLSAEVRLADRWKLAADAAYLPYVTYNWLDDHLERNLQYQMSGQGIGVQTQAVLSYDVTDRLSVGVGGRYWAMWSTSAQRQGIVIGAAVAESTGPNRNTVDLLGAFAQVSYRFAPDRTIAAKPSVLALPLFKAPALRRHTIGPASMAASRAAGRLDKASKLAKGWTAILSIPLPISMWTAAWLAGPSDTIHSSTGYSSSAWKATCPGWMPAAALTRSRRS